jgi:hypothetical protein
MEAEATAELQKWRILPTDLPITSWTHVDFNVLSALLAVGGTRCIVNISKQLQLDPLWAVRLISCEQPPS